MQSRWSWKSAPSEITLETVFGAKDQFCFLVGSGISLDPPSNLPTGYQFTKAILEHLIPLEERANILRLMDPEREGMHDSGDFLRFEQLGNIHGKANHLTHIGLLLFQLGQMTESLEYFHQALAVDEHVGDIRGRVACLANIGAIFTNLGRIDEALNYYMQALQIYEQLGDLRGKARLLTNIGGLLKNQGRLNEALDYYRQALKLAEQLDALDLLKVIQDALKHIQSQI
ncbi:MAG: tetratricopeptide repeat protein [Candidatus Hermodarchaeota archaeon]